jgi:hypothetical protein
VVCPEPCAEEMPDPELLDDPELPDDPELADEPEPLDDPELPEAALPAEELLEPLPAEADVPVPVPLAVVVPLWCADPGRAKAITPAPTRPAAPTAVVAARSRACPCRLAAAADRAPGCDEFIGFPPCFSAQSASRTWKGPSKHL